MPERDWERCYRLACTCNGGDEITFTLKTCAFPLLVGDVVVRVKGKEI